MSAIFLNETLQSVFHIAKAFAKENYNEQFGAAHLLRALLHKEGGLEDFLMAHGKDIYYMREWAEVRIDEYPKVTHLPEEPSADESIDKIMNGSDEVRLRLGFSDVSSLCILAAIVKPYTAFTAPQLKSFPVKESDFLQLINIVPLNTEDEGAFLNGQDRNGIQQSFSNLQKYCKDRTALAENGKLDPIIGRERETRQMIEILSRRTKPNVIIAGEPGVGKTALVDGFAQLIIEEKVPGHLLNAKVLELDLGSVVAGASYKGEVEDRLKKIITEIKQLDRAILFIDEMHVLLDAKGPIGSGAGNLLKPELARGEITVIGATTLEEYRKIIEPEQAFNRRFELLQITEPDIATAEKMVELLTPHYEKHHGVKVEKEAIGECVRLAKRYIKDKRLPDAALDLMDRTMAAIRMMNETSEKDIAEIKVQWDKMKTLSLKSEEERLTEFTGFNSYLKNKLSPVLYGMLTDEAEPSQIDSITAYTNYLEKTIASLEELSKEKREVVGKLEIAAVVASKTNIPIGKIQTQEKEKLLNMENYLKRRMVGQEHALKIISEAIIENRSGLNKPGQPIGSFFLLGPTGTGKTELAKSIAELLFNDEKAMIRFDMSEFKEEHSAALLYGAPPGYVGYEEGGLLVNKIRQQPYSVVLFDEIEKAHQSVFDVFLQIMDEGHMHDKLGKEGDFSNALVLFTSNIGSDFITKKFEDNEIPASTELMERMSASFRPEFLGRLTEIVPFGPITEEMAVKIFDIQMRGLYDLLKKQSIRLTLSDAAKRVLALTGFTPKYGARQIAGVIRQQLRRPLSRKIINGDVQHGSHVMIDIDEQNQITWRY
ncbi:ATP-dependent Clp protease ATP-binding subunit [Chitinophagaceae bacterium 26-R-25]|nr:ATP-dependent Clp protease ATP-binding subunit [Chitinophagaceae bacterium 26-R-25]